jgi:hypothetical protein
MNDREKEDRNQSCVKLLETLCSAACKHAALLTSDQSIAVPKDYVAA